MTFQTQERYGAIQAGFGLELSEPGYFSFIGKNNSGKSALLQLIFKSAPLESHQKIMLFASRELTRFISVPVGETLSNLSQNLNNQIQNEPISNLEQITDYNSKLIQVIINSYGLTSHIRDLNILLERLELPTVDIQGNDQSILAQGAIYARLQGSGFKSVFSLLLALAQPQISLLIVDEPETSLEARLQKKLRDILMEKSKEKTIIVATHSHLLLNNLEVTNNYIVERANEGELSLRQVNDEQTYRTQIYRLLGASLEDLSIPENYVVVEGSSDACIMEKVLEIKGAKDKIKVLAGGDIAQISNQMLAIQKIIIPHIVGSTPYRERVCVLVDEPTTKTDIAKFEEIKKVLTERAVSIPVKDLESYIDEELYSRAELDKKTKLSEIKASKGDYQKESELKKEVSQAIAAVLMPEDLPKYLKEYSELADIAIKKIDEVS